MTDMHPAQAPPMPAEDWFTVPGDRLRQLADAAVMASVVRPGDTLIIGTAVPVTRAQAATLKTEAEERLPGVKVLVVSNVTALATYRPGPEVTHG
jgi:hypothetical protein